MKNTIWPWISKFSELDIHVYYYYRDSNKSLEKRFHEVLLLHTPVQLVNKHSLCISLHNCITVVRFSSCVINTSYVLCTKCKNIGFVPSNMIVLINSYSSDLKHKVEITRFNIIQVKLGFKGCLNSTALWDLVSRANIATVTFHIIQSLFLMSNKKLIVQLKIKVCIFPKF